MSSGMMFGLSVGMNCSLNPLVFACHLSNDEVSSSYQSALSIPSVPFVLMNLNEWFIADDDSTAKVESMGRDTSGTTVTLF